MNISRLSIYALALLISSGMSLPTAWAEPEKTAQEEKATPELPEEGSKEWKRLKMSACQKLVSGEFKDTRQLANLLKKAKNERDYEKINKMAAAVIKKYSAIYLDNQPKSINGIEITTEDLKPEHTKFGSKRRKLYKDFLEYSEKQRARQERNSWNTGSDNKDSRKEKEKEKEVTIDMSALDKVKDILRVNQEEFTAEIDAEIEEKNQKNNPQYGR